MLVRANFKMQKIDFVMPRENLLWLTSFCSSLHNNMDRIDRVKSTTSPLSNLNFVCVGTGKEEKWDNEFFHMWVSVLQRRSQEV